MRRHQREGVRAEKLRRDGRVRMSARANREVGRRAPPALEPGVGQRHAEDEATEDHGIAHR